MTSSATIDAAWLTNVWENTSIKAITPNYYQYAITEDSEAEVSKTYYGAEINFWQATTTRANRLEIAKGGVYEYSLVVDYILQKDTTGDAWKDVRNAFETLFSVVQAWSHTWGDTVDYWQTQDGPPEISEIDLAGTPCWRGRYNFKAFKEVSFS